MPRTYIRKTNRQNWPEEQMQKALGAVRDGMPYKTASRQFKVPVMALKRRAKGKNKIAVGSVKKLGSRQTVFNLEQEQELVDYIKDMEARMYGLTTQDVLALAYQLAERNNLPHPFSQAKAKAGLEWLRGFRRRHPDITMRAPESTSSARARAFNKPVVDKFFATLKNVQEKHYFPPHRIFNVDETSLCTVPTKNSKVFAQTGRKQVARVTSAERGETTTAVICTSASGTFVPPMLIFRRVRMKIELMDGAPPGATYACNPSGWMKLDVFSQWFDHFLSHAKPTAEDPALLILDGHLSHTKNLNVILKARDNHVTIICLPPHCTHKLQPLDVGVMYPLSVYHNQALEKWMNNNPGRVVTVFQIAKIFTEAYLKAAVPLNSMNGFNKTGICPFNPDVFTNLDFVAAETTEMDVDNDTVEPPIPIPGMSSTPLAEAVQACNPETATLQPLQVDGQEPLLLSSQLSSRQTSTPIHIPIAGTSSPPLVETVQPSNPETATLQPLQVDGQESLLLLPQLSPRQTSTSVHLPIPRTSSPSLVETVQANNPETETPQPLQVDGQESLLISPQPSQLQTWTPKITQKSPQAPQSSGQAPSFPKNTSTSESSGRLPPVLAVGFPSTSFSVVTPKEVRPTPKIVGKRASARRIRVDTSVLTSTPYKKYLEEEVKKKTDLEQKKALKEANKIKKTVTNKQKDKGKRGGKGKGGGKRVGKKKQNRSDSSEEESDTECLFCTESYSKDNKGEGWIRCIVCLKWGHEACAGVDSDDEGDFTCDICLSSNQFDSVKRNLRL